MSPQADATQNEFDGVDDGQLVLPGSLKEYSESMESLESQESNDLLIPLEASTVPGAPVAPEALEESWMEEEDVEIPWPWMLFVLSGNTKVANRRQRDLGTYLRLNLAARLDADYNDVAINRILLTQDSILANISVEPSHLVGTGAVGLETLGQGNVTLLELSGHEFTVDRIIRVTELVDQRFVNFCLFVSLSLSLSLSHSFSFLLFFWGFCCCCYCCCYCCCAVPHFVAVICRFKFHAY